MRGNRIIIRYYDTEDINSIQQICDIWQKERGYMPLSLKIYYEEGGKQMVAYDRGEKDSIVISKDKNSLVGGK